MKRLPIRKTVAAFAAGACAGAFAQQPMKLADLADLSLEQLANITVTSASRREERLVEAPASIFVITSEDIRRSGATSLPEALRLAPNLQVARADTSQYVITARGGLAGTANKMLVLIDGRTVYTPLFAGVYWDAQIAPIEDIERIEVISGPGATLWGTNAVNGVINITSKPAARTQGTQIAVGAGSEERGVNARTGAQLPGGGAYRVYARYYDRDAHQLQSGASARDEVDRWQAGFRADWDRARGSATLQGDVYGANVDNLGGDRPLSGANVLARWRTHLGPDSDLFVQTYYDRTDREHIGSFKEKRDTFDVEMQHSLMPRTDHRLVWGAGYRASRDRTDATPSLVFIPGSRTLTMGTLFAQDEVDFGQGLHATVGLRAERNQYTGVEWLPNLRLSYAASPDQLVWGALARAVREPSRIDRDLYSPGSPPYVVVGNDTFVSEIADVAELGYRARIAEGATVSFTAFHHRFRRLRTVEPGPLGVVIANGAEGSNNGIEGWGDFALHRDWRLTWGFVAMRERFETSPGRIDFGSLPLANDPRRTATLRSLWNVTSAHQLDLALRYVGALPNPAVPSYTVLDARFGWHVTKTLDLSLAVSNALDRRHSEFGTPTQSAVLERAYFVKLTWTP